MILSELKLGNHMKHLNLRFALVLSLLVTGCSNFRPFKQAVVETDPDFVQMHEILARIKPPKFADRNFPITQFGAKPGVDNDSSDAITKAIAACNAAGGGHVIVPQGEWLTGPVVLKSNVDLHLEEGAVLKFKTDPNAYLPQVFSRFESSEIYGFSPFIYALDQENIAVTGKGTLDGQANAQNWWSWIRGRPGRSKIAKMNMDSVPVTERVFTEADGLRPNFFQPVRCKNVMIEGVKIRNSPMWEVNPTLCTNVIVRGLDIVSHGPNNDGCDPDSCKDVLIENCLFDTGDDCIAIKSGRNNDGRRVNVASENIVIRNCDMKDGHGGVTIGSEISGSCRNVFVENCRMDSPNLNVVLRFKSNAVRGGTIENIHMRDVTVGQVAQQVLQIDFVYEEGANGPYKPTAQNITMKNVTVDRAPRLMSVVGFPGSIIKDVTIKNSTFKSVLRDSVMREADVQVVDCVVGKPAPATNPQ